MSESTEHFIEAKAASQTWERRSQRPEDGQVLGHTDNWLTALPMGVRPVYLQKDFPRIANDLARLWADTSALDRYFAEKEFSPRRGRRGFPPLIKEELLAMLVFFLRTRPTPQEERALRRVWLLG
jgi:hypothetical protein